METDQRVQDKKMEKKAMGRSRNSIVAALADWKPDMNLGIVARAASLFAHAAGEIPKEIVPWPVVVKYVLGGKLPHPDSQLCVDMMKRSGSIRNTLLKDHKKGLKTVAKVGARATTDDDDYVVGQLIGDAKRLESARKRFVESGERVDAKKMKDKALRAWVETDVQKALVQCSDRLSKLLLPPGDLDVPESESKKNGGRR